MINVSFPSAIAASLSALFPHPSGTVRNRTSGSSKLADQANPAGAQCQPSCILSPHLASFVCFSFSPRCITLHTLYAFFSHFPFCAFLPSLFVLLLVYYISSSALSETHPASHQTRHLLFIRDVTSCFGELLRLYITVYTLNARRLCLTVIFNLSKHINATCVLSYCSNVKNHNILLSAISSHFKLTT